MTQTTSKNDFFTEGPFVVIGLHDQHFTIINKTDHDKVRNYPWRAVRHGRCFYAKTTVGTLDQQTDLSMHRIIAKTPFGMVCHHRNRNSLDNRSENLINMAKKDHDTLHANNTLLIKYHPPQTGLRPPPSICDGGAGP